VLIDRIWCPVKWKSF